MAREKFPIRLVDAYQIAPMVRHLVFKRDDDKPFEFIPGQFINIHFDYDGESLQRSYSVATLPEAGRDTVDIAISYVSGGRASQFFSTLENDTILQASGPAGRLVLTDDNPARYVFIATGTGVAPYRAMLPELSERLSKQKGLRVCLVMGVRKMADLIYDDDFRALAKRHPDFEYFACLSQESAVADSSYQRIGRVTEHLDSLNLNCEQDLVYLCGNPAMVDDAFVALKEKSFGNKQVKREKYVFGK